MIKEIQNIVDRWVVDDLILGGKMDVLPATFIQGQEKHALLKRHALLYGLTVLHLNLSMQQVGLGLINQWYDVVQMAFLYNQVNHTKIMTVELA